MQKPNFNEFATNRYNNNGNTMVNAFLSAAHRNYTTSLPHHNQHHHHHQHHHHDQTQEVNNVTTENPNSLYESVEAIDRFIVPTLCHTTTVTTDVGICVGMSNCHLTEEVLGGDYSILQHYQPHNVPAGSVMSTPINGYHNNYIFNKEKIQEVYYLNRFKYIEVDQCNSNNNSNHLSDIERSSENAYQRSNCNKFITNIFKSNNYEMNLVDGNASGSSCGQKISSTIKFQDKNRRMDFKTNFLEENRKIDGCFHDYYTFRSSNNVTPEETVDSTASFGSDITADVVASAPPKKKWIRHYLKEEVKPASNNTDGTPSLVVISRPNVPFSTPSQQQATIDLSKSSTINYSHPISTAPQITSVSIKPLQIPNGTIVTTSTPHNSITLYNIDESQTSLNLSTESSGYHSNSNNSSLANISFNHTTSQDDPKDLDKSINTLQLQQQLQQGDQLQQEVQRIQQQVAFNPVQLPTSTISGRRRTISSNSNSGALRSPSTVRPGTREVHNKLEKNRRAHLKECFEALKKQLPITADEKKTSNLAILGAAIRHIQFLKRKEREYEHEMERLAKEKIASQNRILFLKRELAHWDIDFSKFFFGTEVESVKAEPTSEQLNNENGVKYSSTSSLSSIATASSTANATTTTTTTNMSPTMPVSPSRTTIMGSPMPLATKSTLDDSPLKLTTNHVKMVATTLTHNTNSKSPIITNQNSQTHQSHLAALNLKSAETLSAVGTTTIPLTTNQTMPLNLHASTSSITNIYPKNIMSKEEPLNGLKNGMIKSHSTNDFGKMDKDKFGKPTSVATITHIQTPSPVNTKSDIIEPPTKMIKLINGAVAPVDNKDNNKYMQVALSQVVGGGGLVVSPIQLLTSTQGLRVIGQPSSLTTIELTSPPVNGQPIQHRPNITQQITTPVTGAQLHKLLVNGTPATTTNINTLNIPVTQPGNRITPELSRLAGGAELNVLSTNTPNGTMYRSQGGKLAIVNNGLTIKETANSSRTAVHVVTPIQSTGLTPIVVSQGGQNTANLAHIIAASPSQLTGKVMGQLPVGGHSLPILTASTQYLKPMVVVTNQNNNVSAANTIDSSSSSFVISNNNNKHLATTSTSKNNN